MSERLAFRAEARQFASAVGWVAAQLPTKNENALLMGVMLTVENGRLCVSGFDYDVATRAELDVTGETDGVVLVSGRLLAEVSKDWPAKPVDVSYDGKRVSMVCGTARLTLPCMPVEDYPKLPAQPATTGTVDASAFVAAVESVAFAASRDAAQKALVGVNLRVGGGVLKLSATNRYCAAIAKIPWQGDAEGSATVVSGVLAKAAGGFAGGSVEIALSAGLLGMSAPDRSIITRLMDAEYPDMERLMPPKQETPARVPIDMLSAALRMADKVKAPKAPVLLTLDAGNMNVAATDDENAFSDDVMCAYDGAEFTVRVNPEYILGGLAALRAPMADMHVIDNPRAPVLLTASQDGEAVTRPDYQFMFMPIRPVETKTEPVKDATRVSLRKKLEET